MIHARGIRSLDLNIYQKQAIQFSPDNRSASGIPQVSIDRLQKDSLIKDDYRLLFPRCSFEFEFLTRGAKLKLMRDKKNLCADY